MLEFVGAIFSLFFVAFVVYLGIAAAFIPKPPYPLEESEQKEEITKEIYSPYDTINS